MLEQITNFLFQSSNYVAHASQSLLQDNNVLISHVHRTMHGFDTASCYWSKKLGQSCRGRSNFQSCLRCLCNSIIHRSFYIHGQYMCLPGQFHYRIRSILSSTDPCDTNFFMMYPIAHQIFEWSSGMYPILLFIKEMLA